MSNGTDEPTALDITLINLSKQINTLSSPVAPSTRSSMVRKLSFGRNRQLAASPTLSAASEAPTEQAGQQRGGAGVVTKLVRKLSFKRAPAADARCDASDPPSQAPGPPPDESVPLEAAAAPTAQGGQRRASTGVVTKLVRKLSFKRAPAADARSDAAAGEEHASEEGAAAESGRPNWPAWRRHSSKLADDDGAAIGKQSPRLSLTDFNGLVAEGAAKERMPPPLAPLHQ